MKLITKTVLSVLVTAVIGVFTLIFTAPKKSAVANAGTMQKEENKQKENLFI